MGAIIGLLAGTSPRTGWLGVLIMILSGAQLVTESLHTGGVPTNLNGWIEFALGLGLRLAKDANKSNAPAPVEVPRTV